MMDGLTQFQAQAAGIALHKMLLGHHFSICDLDSLAKLVGVELGGKDYQALRGLHCMNWADIPEPLRTQAREKIVELLGLPPMIIEGEKATQQQPSNKPKLRLAFWKKP